MLLNTISLGWHSLRQGKCSNVFANDSAVNDNSLTKHQICSKISLIISTPLLRKIAVDFYKEAKVLFISADFNIVKKTELVLFKVWLIRDHFSHQKLQFQNRRKLDNFFFS
jgi:hypothetical protein